MRQHVRLGSEIHGYEVLGFSGSRDSWDSAFRVEGSRDSWDSAFRVEGSRVKVLRLEGKNEEDLASGGQFRI